MLETAFLLTLATLTTDAPAPVCDPAVEGLARRMLESTGSRVRCPESVARRHPEARMLCAILDENAGIFLDFWETALAKRIHGAEGAGQRLPPESTAANGTRIYRIDTTRIELRVNNGVAALACYPPEPTKEDPAATTTDSVAIPLPAATSAPDGADRAPDPSRSVPPADELRDRLRLALAASGADPFACPESMTRRAPTATMVCATYDGEIDEFRLGWDRWMARNADALTAVPEEDWTASSTAASHRYRLSEGWLEVRVSRSGASVTVRPTAP